MWAPKSAAPVFILCRWGIGATGTSRERKKLFVTRCGCSHAVEPVVRTSIIFRFEPGIACRASLDAFPQENADFAIARWSCGPIMLIQGGRDGYRHCQMVQ